MKTPIGNDFKHKLREAVADYMYSEGCSCCRAEPEHTEDQERLAYLLDVPQYRDGSGYNFSRFSRRRRNRRRI